MAKPEEEMTYQLSLCEVFLPPQVLVHRWEHGESVVGVHKDVDKAVQGWSKKTCRNTAEGLLFRQEDCAPFSSDSSEHRRKLEVWAIINIHADTFPTFCAVTLGPHKNA